MYNSKTSGHWILYEFEFVLIDQWIFIHVFLPWQLYSEMEDNVVEITHSVYPDTYKFPFTDETFEMILFSFQVYQYFQ